MGVADSGDIDFFAADRSLPGDGGARFLEALAESPDGNNS